MQSFIVTATKSRNKIHRDYWSSIRAESKDDAIIVAKRGTRGLIDITCYTRTEWAIHTAPVNMSPADAVSLAVDTVRGADIGAALTSTATHYVMWHGARKHCILIAETNVARLLAHWSGFVANCTPVSLAKPDAPECVAVLHAVMYEPNAEVMARAVETVRNRRLTAEYLAAHDDEPATLDDGMSSNEQVRALAAEQARADAARMLSGVECASNRDPMATEHCETCGDSLESGQIGDCDSCQDAHAHNAQVIAGDDDDDDNPNGFINHYKCYACGAEWIDEWDCGVDDECGECGARDVSPYLSEEVKA